MAKKKAGQMTIGVVNNNLCTTGIIDQLLHEGHKIVLLIAVPNMRISDGMFLANRYGKQVEVINEGDFYGKLTIEPGCKLLARLTELAKKCDFVFFDYVKAEELVEMASQLRFCGAEVIGPTVETRAIEMVREEGKRVAEECDDSDTFKHSKYMIAQDANEALAYVRRHKGNFLIKGDYITVKPINALDCQDLLSKPYANQMLGTPMFLEKEITEPFEEIAFSYFFDGQRFIDLVVVNREYKGIYNEGAGAVFCGEAGSILEFHPKADVPHNIEAVMDNMESWLRKTSFRGFIDINTLYLTKTGHYHFLEWTPRSGIPTEHLIAAVAAESGFGYGNFLKSLVNTTGKETSYVEMHGYRVASVALQWRPTNADHEGMHSPLVHGLEMRDYGSGSRHAIMVKNPPNKMSVATVSLLYGVYDSEGRVMASPIDKDRTLVINAVAHMDDDEDYEALIDDLHASAKQVNAWSHYKRTDIGDELRNYSSLLDLLVK